MLPNTLKILRLLAGLALMQGGLWVLVRGGFSLHPPHVVWGCIELALAQIIPGALLFRLNVFLSLVSGR